MLWILSLLRWLDNLCYRLLLRQIWVSSIPKEPTCDLYSNYAEQIFVTISGREKERERESSYIIMSVWYKASALDLCHDGLCLHVSTVNVVYTILFTRLESTGGVVSARWYHIVGYYQFLDK